MKTPLCFFKRPLPVLTLLMVLCLAYSGKAQTTLVAGDIAFTGYNSNNNGTGGQNDFSFVILRAGGISANTTINFTDNGYKIAGTNALNTVEGTLVWTSTSAMAQFTQVYIKVEPNAGASILALSAGSIAGGFSNFILSQAGDQVLAYQGSSASPTFISAIHMNSDPGSTAAGWDNMASGTTLTQNRSDLPPGLTTGVNCVVPDPNIGSSEKDNGIYNCTGSSGASLSAVRTAINTATNWNIQDVTLYSIPPVCTIAISSPLSASATGTNVSCNGSANGRASVSATGGTPGYSYSWAPSGGTAALATGLAPGIYTVTVTDAASASVSATVMITQPPALIATTGFTNTSCNGLSNGRASVSASGGTSPYTYSWAPSGGTAALATGLAANNYTCTITDNNSCTRTVTVTVSQPSAIVATVTSTNVSCNGGNNGIASVSVSGGTPSYFYSWAPSGGTASTATGLTAGNYTVTTTDNNSCSRTATVAITQPSAINTSTSTVNASCFGYSNGIVAISASGGTSPYTYTWSPTGGNSSVAVGMPAGSYTVNGRDNAGCPFSRICIVTQPPALVASVSFTNATCNGGSDGSANVNVSGGIPGYTYTWTPSGGNNPLATGLSANTYTCAIEDVNGCPLTKTVTVGEPTAISITTAVTNVACNGGSNGVASVTVTGGIPGYTYSWTPSGGTAASASGLAAGNYTVTVRDANNCTGTAFANVTQPTALVTTTAVTNVACNGGSNGVASISASGGAGGYTYLWSTGSSLQTITGLMAGVYTATVTDANNCKAIKSAQVTQPTALVTTTAVTNVACNAGSTGSATITASGGAGGYSYLWSTGASAASIGGQMAGVYTATVTDANSCTSIKAATITQPTALVTTTAVTNVACNGGSNGSATVTVSGGTPGYTYSWAPSGGTAASATGLAAGNYTVTVTDANNCTKTAFANLTQPTAMITSTAVTAVSCNGSANGVASVTVTAGTPGYTYSWAPSGGTAATATGLAAGNYTVTVRDANNCAATAFANVTQPTAISTSTAVASVLCNGGSTGSATVTASGGTGAYTYSWSPSGGTSAAATGLAAGNYTVTVKDANNCTKTAFANVSQPTALTTSTAVTNILCNGGSTGSATVTATGGTGSYTYSWSPSGGTSAAATGLAAGNYTVTVKDANNCAATAFANLTQPTAITATPSQTNATCGTNNGSASVVVTGGTGAYMYSWAPSGGTAATATGLAAGNYTVTVTDANSCVKTQTYTIGATGTINGVITTTAVSCNGGNNGVASVAASGGSGAFTYTWSPSGGTAATASGLTSGIYTVQVKDATACTVSFTANVAQPAALAANVTFTNVLCNGASNGVATASVSGGTGAYSYTWSPSGGNAATASGLAMGTYTVNIKDANNCTLSRTVSISQPTALSATISGTNITCGGGTNGTASVSATGGTGAYTYSWTPSGGTAATANGLTAGNYTVTVKDANLCTITRSITLTEPAPMTAVTSQTNLSCNGSANGAASIAVTGGAGSYTYSWTPSGGTAASATGLAANNYTVTVKDANNCSIIRTYTITQPAVLAVSMSYTNISCNGAADGIATASVSGGTAAYSYSWAPTGGNASTATGLNAGTYTLTVKDANQCQATATVTITQPAALSATITTANATCNGSANGSATVSVAGGTAAYSYTWSPSGGNAAIASGLAAGNYSVAVKDANSCMLTRTLTITEPTAIVATVSHTNISCFGLTNGTASVSATGGSGTYTYSWMPGGSAATSISGLGAGTYTVNVKDASNCQISATVAIIEPAAITHTQNVAICQGQSVTVGTSTYTAAGTYTNVLTSIGGCDSTVTTVLTVNAPPTLTVTASNGTVCAGTSATLTATGATTYTWSNGVANGTGFIPASTQTYTVTGANGGCSVTATISINVNPKPTVVANTTSTLICKGNSVTLTGSGASTYTWTNGVVNGTAFSPTTTATYTVTGTNNNGCTNTAVVTVSVNPCTGIESYSSEVAVSVNPNPVNSTATVSIRHFDQIASGKLSLDLYDNTGRIVKQLIVTEAETVLSREGLAEGLYYYHITANGSTILKGKLIVQ